MHQSVLSYNGFRYLKIASIAVVAAIVAYAVVDPGGAHSGHNGGTWLGYTLGSIGALLILWLMWFGIKKRRYSPGRTPLVEWLSAHVYLGIALIIVATLHTGFQFGLNIHTLAYTLMMIVIISGMYGLYAYVRYPAEMTANRDGRTLDDMLRQCADIDAEARSVAMNLGDEINNAILRAAKETKVGGGVLRQLSGREPNCPTAAALATVQRLSTSVADNDAPYARRLLSLMSRKSELLRRARRDVRFLSWMQVWLFFHVPLSFALLAALIGHILSVFIYW